MEPIILIVLVVLVVLVLLGRRGSLSGLVVNGIVGVGPALPNEPISRGRPADLPTNLPTLIICALGGVVGWLIILVLHFLGIAF